MTVVFLANFHKTAFFAALARELSDGGIPCEIWALDARHRLTRAGVPGAVRMIDLSVGEPRSFRSTAISSHTGVDILTSLDVPLGFLVAADRLLRERPWTWTLGWLEAVVSKLERNLARAAPRLVVGEATWTWEVLCAAAARAHGIPYVVPHTVRIPDDRFAFFEGVQQANQLGPEDADEARRVARDVRHAWLEGRRKPYYFHLNNKAPSLGLADASKAALKSYDAVSSHPFNTTQARVRDYLGARGPIGQVVRNRGLMRWFDTSALREPPSEPFVFLPLHKQPEASIDILGWQYRDQMALVRSVAEAAGRLGLRTMVKEHSNALGDRSLARLQEVANLPGVAMVHPQADAWLWLHAASATLTVSGTVAYEAGLLGRQALTLAPMFFDRLPTVTHVPGLSSLPDLLARAATAGPARPEDVDAGLEQILAKTYSGRIGDMLTTPAVGAVDNVGNVVAAMRRLLEG